jgi:hypothetical protein
LSLWASPPVSQRLSAFHGPSNTRTKSAIGRTRISSPRAALLLHRVPVAGTAVCQNQDRRAFQNREKPFPIIRLLLFRNFRQFLSPTPTHRRNRIPFRIAGGVKIRLPSSSHLRLMNHLRSQSPWRLIPVLSRPPSRLLHTPPEAGTPVATGATKSIRGTRNALFSRSRTKAPRLANGLGSKSCTRH